jgi:hypothetical protein
MHVTSGARARLGLGCLAATLAAFAVVGTASAADSGTVTVTGSSASKIVLVLSDTDADFGTAMTPDGDASGEAGIVPHVDPAATSTGACYEWGGSAQVRSNVLYSVSVDADVSVPQLGFLTANPGGFAACTGGEPVDTDMFTSTSGEFAAGQARTPSRDHDFWLGLRVLWTDPLLDLGSGVTLTITAQADS